MAGALRAPIMAAMSGRGTSLATRGMRLARLTLHLLRGLLTAAAVFPFLSPARRRAAVKRWSHALLRIVGVRLHVHGPPPHRQEPPAMLVANHVSWLDICAINAVVPVRFVAKSEVRAWPMIGWLSAKAGTLFIERSRRRDTARINREVAEAMLRGDVVAVFPEGTTTDGSHVLRFHSSLLQPALLAEADVHPVALRFERSDGSLCVEAAYDGDKSLWDTLLLIIAQPVLHAHVWFLEALPAGTAHRRTLAQAAQHAIAVRLKA
jgi:1-acyl-sn-glycerol-3-phosphate acyltransferase